MRRTPAPTLCLTPDRRSRPGHRAGRVRSGFPRVFSHGYLTTSGLPTLEVAANDTVTLPAASSQMVPVKLRVQQGQARPGVHAIEFELRDSDEPEIVARDRSVFVIR